MSVCDKFETSTECSEAAAALAAAEADSGHEKILLVPNEIAELSLGFAVDAGGSVYKLIYRSKIDYVNGKSKEENAKHGKLRLRYFRLGSDDELVQFIQENCDIMESSRYQPDKKGPVWFQTGVYTQHFKAVMEEALNIKTKMYSEMLAMSSVVEVCRTIPELKCYRPSVKSAACCLKTFRSMMSFMENIRVAGDTSYEKKIADNNFLQEYVKKMMTIDPEAFAAELEEQEIEYPCMFVLCGSACSINIMNADGTSIPCYFTTMSGKTFLGLGEALTGAKDFDELIAMASRGDNEKVDILSGDLKYKGRDEKDWYSSMPDDFVVFSLGKLTNNKLQNNVPYSKDDLAAGVLHLHCSTLAKFANLNARLNKIKSVVFCGSFVDPPIVRDTIERYFLTNSVLQILEGGDQTRIHFLPYPGYFCGLGVWFQNLEIEKQFRKK